MEQLITQLREGENYFGSGGTVTPEFKKFARQFKTEFKKELRDIGGKLEEFKSGHFYLYGFFTKGGQLYYFNLSDVRWWHKEPKLMYRTAAHQKDWTGGANRYITLRKGFAKEIR